MAEQNQPPKLDENPPSNFRVKTISYGTKLVTICMQNENGPCPLLAICNVLLLKGDMFIHPDMSYVSLDELLVQLSACILKYTPAEFTSEGEKMNYEANVAACIATFPELARGLDVNVRYDGVFGFEFTPQLAVFDLVRVPLCHGWLPDPAGEEYEIIQPSSYNQLVEKAIASQIEMDLNRPHEPLSTGSDTATSSGASSSSPQNQSSAPSSHAPSSSTDPSTNPLHGQMIAKWLEDTASQLTFYGITKLYEELQQGQFAVLFRNNHFSTIHMRNASLWSLLTDQGFTKQAAVWEKLQNVDGDSQFVTSDFTPFKGTAEDYANLHDASDMHGLSEPPKEFDQRIDLDAQLAAQLQDAENRRAEKERNAQQSQQPPPKRTAAPRGTPGKGPGKSSLSQSTPSRRPPGQQPSGSVPRPNNQPNRQRSNSDGKNKKKKDDDCCIL